MLYELQAALGRIIASGTSHIKGKAKAEIIDKTAATNRILNAVADIYDEDEKALATLFLSKYSLGDKGDKTLNAALAKLKPSSSLEDARIRNSMATRLEKEIQPIRDAKAKLEAAEDKRWELEDNDPSGQLWRTIDAHARAGRNGSDPKVTPLVRMARAAVAEIEAAKVAVRDAQQALKQVEAKHAGQVSILQDLQAAD